MFAKVAKTFYKFAMKFFRNLLWVLVPTLGFASPALASYVSEWHEGDFSKARLIASHQAVPGEPGEDLYLGFQVKMEEGWKTYWRSPGDAGQPPVFDWEGSVNLLTAEVYYPAPIRFELFNLQTYGYPNEVVYPIKITPGVYGAPMTVHAKVSYLVCKDLCVPVVSEFSLTLPGVEGAAPYSLKAGLIERYLEKVPERDGKKVEVRDLELLGPAGVQNLVFRLRGENLMTGADIIIEDLPEFSFGIPKRRILIEANEVEFIVPVTARGEKKNLAGEKVLVTLMDGWGNLDEREFILEPN